MDVVYSSCLFTIAPTIDDGSNSNSITVAAGKKDEGGFRGEARQEGEAKVPPLLSSSTLPISSAPYSQELLE